MNIKKCTICGEIPDFYAVDELGMIYCLKCKCPKSTHEHISLSSSLENPLLDDYTKKCLIEEWNAEKWNAKD